VRYFIFLVAGIVSLLAQPDGPKSQPATKPLGADQIDLVGTWHYENGAMGDFHTLELDKSLSENWVGSCFRRKG